jgi:hypothetical protein
MRREAIMQHVLDPLDPTTHGTWRPTGPIPASVRALGRFPDVRAWRAGDLVLVSALAPEFLSRRIVLAQERGGFAPIDARWHHAAVYLGDGRICEATLGGVQARRIDGYIGTHLIRVRRDPLITETEGYDIAVHALFRMRWYYSVWTIVRMLLQSWRGFYDDPVGLRFAARHSVICSILYADAYSLVTQRVLGNAAGATPTPAFLSSTPALTDVACRWSAIVP